MLQENFDILYIYMIYYFGITVQFVAYLQTIMISLLRWKYGTRYQKGHLQSPLETRMSVATETGHPIHPCYLPISEVVVIIREILPQKVTIAQAAGLEVSAVQKIHT